MAGGLTNRNIAEYVNLSPHTVDAHLKHIYIKLDIHSRVELTVLALQHRSAMTTSPSLRHPSRDGLRGSDRSIRPTLPSSDGKVVAGVGTGVAHLRRKRERSGQATPSHAELAHALHGVHALYSVPIPRSVGYRQR